MEPFGFFNFSPIGLLVLASGTGYMLLIGRRLLPGNCGFNDFVKVSTPMVLLVMAVPLLTVPLLFPL